MAFDSKIDKNVKIYLNFVSKITSKLTENDLKMTHPPAQNVPKMTHSPAQKEVENGPKTT